MTQRAKAPALLAACIAAALGVTHQAAAQTNYQFRGDGIQNLPTTAEPAPNGDWNLDTNGAGTDGESYWWSSGLQLNFIPDHAIGDGENAYIENGGLAYVTSDGGIYPGRIVIGEASGTSGAVEVRSGGVMRALVGGAVNGNITVGSASGTGTLTVLPGGTMSAESSLVSGNNAANSIVVGGAGAGTASLTAGSAQLNAVTHVYSNADFAVGGALAFGSQGNSNYIVQATGNNASGKITAGGTANLNGSLTLDIGYTPALGDSWTVLQADSFNGSFSSINSNLSLAYNQNLVATKVASGGQMDYKIGLEEVLVLEVNRDTGVATLTHPGSSTVQLDGYFIGSEGGLLNASPSAWTSLSEGGQLGADWIETDQRADNIGELKIGADATFGADVSLGAIYNPLAGEFGANVDDLQFTFRRSSDGAQIPGVVQYTGSKANTLVLQVDPSGSGDTLLRNTSATTVEIDGYEILSAAGSLDTAGWTGIDGAGTDWVEAINNSANQLVEFNTTGFTTLAPGATLNLGDLFDGSAQDLDFNFLLMGEEEATAGVVVYEAYVPPAGDFNNDGIVNAADYTVYRDNLGAAGLPNDNGLGTVGEAHYELWRDNYGATSGAASSVASAVPEPSSVAMVVVMLGLSARRR